MSVSMMKSYSWTVSFLKRCPLICHYSGNLLANSAYSCLYEPRLVPVSLEASPSSALSRI